MVDFDTLQADLINQQQFLLTTLQEESQSLKTLLLTAERSHAGYNLLDIDPNHEVKFTKEEAEQIIAEVFLINSHLSLFSVFPWFSLYELMICNSCGMRVMCFLS
jgi:hypothetical protein